MALAPWPINTVRDSFPIQPCADIAGRKTTDPLQKPLEDGSTLFPHFLFSTLYAFPRCHPPACPDTATFRKALSPLRSELLQSGVLVFCRIRQRNHQGGWAGGWEDISWSRLANRPSHQVLKPSAVHWNRGIRGTCPNALRFSEINPRRRSAVPADTRGELQQHLWPDDSHSGLLISCSSAP